MTSEATAFEPGKYLTQISGRDYLEVKWRLLWLRTEHPDAAIETEMHRDDGTQAVFKARVTLPSGASATGWGQETAHDFGDYIEKAETKSLGRALAALGFGTQFCQDFDFGAVEGGRVVDSPVDITSVRGVTGGRPAAVGDRATERQIKAIYAIARAGRLDDAYVTRCCQEQYGVAPDQLHRRDASNLIDLLKQEIAANATPTSA